eukprot:c9329_g1_i1 orf=100-1299(+)
MSVFTKAISPSSSFCQVAQTLVNEDFIIMPNANRLPFMYQRHGLHYIEHSCRYHVRAFSAVSVDAQSHSEVTSQGSKRRGRPRKNAIYGEQALQRNSAESQVFYKEENKQESASVTQAHEGQLFKYTEVVQEVVYQQLDDELGVSAAVVKHIAEVAKMSIRTRGWFTIALSGGSLAKVLKELVDEPDIDWTKWHVFWVDERVVPRTDNDSNFKLAMETFLSKARIPKDQIHSIKYGKDAFVVAKRYEQLMRGLVKRKVLSLDSSGAFPRFDLILLGMGPDGHVASLFPNSLALAEKRDWVVAVLQSPKPPPERISMTLPCINAAAHVCFVVVGLSKAEILQRVLERHALPGSLPAQMVRPSNGPLHWFVDKAAAGNLSVDTWGDSKKFPAVNYSAGKNL